MNDVTFGDFRFDLTNECLWQGARHVYLRPKAFAVLKLLIEHPGQLVNKQQVLDAVWPNTFVGDAVLKDNIRQLREALNDDAESPRYIETAHRRGYRFIARIDAATEVSRPTAAPSDVLEQLYRPEKAAKSPITILGRETELSRLRSLLERVLSGERQTVFITGEAGIGKTTLVQAFLEQAAAMPGMLVAHGQCLEHFGAGEAYLPVLDGFTRLCRSKAGAHVLDILRQHAPAWLAHMSSLVPAGERGTLQSQTAGATRERILREMAEAIEQLTADSPLLLVLEDLHWSDYSTLDLISYLARRRDTARLMVVGTYRPVDVIIAGHPLRGVKRELQAHRLCHDFPLEYLTEKDVAGYLRTRFPRQHFPTRLRQVIHLRTEGNPLFMVNLVEYLIDQKVIVEKDGVWTVAVDLTEAEQGVPSSLRELIEKQIERLSSEERTVLEAASVAGMEFCAVAVAAGLEASTDWVERNCEELARRHQFLSPSWLGELPDGTISPRYRFNHVLYREVPYNMIAPMRRSQIHQRIADRGITLFHGRANEIAAELAMHFEQSRDWPRALDYLIVAARNATQRSAQHEAAELAHRGLEVIKLVPESSERLHQELTLRMIETISLITIKGFAAAEVETIHAMGKELFWSSGPTVELFGLLNILFLFHLTTGVMSACNEASEQMMHVALVLDDPALLMEAHRAMGISMLECGRCCEALDHLDLSTKLYAEHGNHRHRMTIVHDCKVVTEIGAARALWALGYPDRALSRMQAVLNHAREIAHPQSLVLATHFAANIHQLRGEPVLAQERGREVAKLADEYGLDFWIPFGDIDLGWAEAELGNLEHGIELLQRGVSAHGRTATFWQGHHIGLLATQLAKAGRIEEAQTQVTATIATTEERGENYSLAELYRIKGELLVLAARARNQSKPPRGKKQNQAPDNSNAQQCFAEAINIAKQQKAKSWEWRIHATMDRLSNE